MVSYKQDPVQTDASKRPWFAHELSKDDPLRGEKIRCAAECIERGAEQVNDRGYIYDAEAMAALLDQDQDAYFHGYDPYIERFRLSKEAKPTDRENMVAAEVPNGVIFAMEGPEYAGYSLSDAVTSYLEKTRTKDGQKPSVWIVGRAAAVVSAAHIAGGIPGAKWLDLAQFIRGLHTKQSFGPDSADAYAGERIADPRLLIIDLTEGDNMTPKDVGALAGAMRERHYMARLPTVFVAPCGPVEYVDGLAARFGWDTIQTLRDNILGSLGSNPAAWEANTIDLSGGLH